MAQDDRLSLLRNASTMMTDWQVSKRTGLTTQTFIACRQTLTGLADATEYLIERKRFSYVMLGKFQSDCIEGRFGRYRMLGGANFYVSVTQVLQGEQKLRVLGLLKDKVNFKSLLTDMDDNISTNVSTSTAIGDVLALVDLDMESLDVSDKNVIYFVAGYIGRSISRQRKCDDCKSLLVLKNSRDDHDIDVDKEELLQMASRGGLSSPTELNFMICCICYLCFTFVDNDNDLRNTFLKSDSHRSYFVAAVRAHCEQTEAVKSLLAVKCHKGHAAFSAICTKIFNCFCKNLLKRLNDGHGSMDQSKTNRKIRKLQSENAK